MLRELDVSYVDRILQLEADPQARQFIQPYARERHLEEFACPDTRYLGIETETIPSELAGFILLKLEKDGAVEFRRIVVAEKNRGTGKKAIAALHNYCRETLKATRIWLDFFEDNLRARHLYTQAGYIRSGTNQFNGRTLIVMTKELAP